MTDNITPRTDAFHQAVLSGRRKPIQEWIDFSRTLERELADCRAELERKDTIIRARVQELNVRDKRIELLEALQSGRLASHAEREEAEYWVIEKSGNPAFYWKITHREKGQTKYYRGCWVGDVQLATMFSHKETAEEEMQFMLNNSDERGLRVCGHTNVGPSPGEQK